MTIPDDDNKTAESYVMCWSWVEINKEFNLLRRCAFLAKAKARCIHHQDGYDFTLLSALFSFRYPVNPIGFSHTKSFCVGTGKIHQNCCFAFSFFAF